MTLSNILQDTRHTFKDGSGKDVDITNKGTFQVDMTQVSVTQSSNPAEMPVVLFIHYISPKVGS